MTLIPNVPCYDCVRRGPAQTRRPSTSRGATTAYGPLRKLVHRRRGRHGVLAASCLTLARPLFFGARFRTAVHDHRRLERAYGDRGSTSSQSRTRVAMPPLGRDGSGVLSPKGTRTAPWANRDRAQSDTAALEEGTSREDVGISVHSLNIGELYPFQLNPAVRHRARGDPLPRTRPRLTPHSHRPRCVLHRWQQRALLRRLAERRICDLLGDEHVLNLLQMPTTGSKPKFYLPDPPASSAPIKGTALRERGGGAVWAVALTCNLLVLVGRGLRGLRRVWGAARGGDASHGRDPQAGQRLHRPDPVRRLGLHHAPQQRRCVLVQTRASHALVA